MLLVFSLTLLVESWQEALEITLLLHLGWHAHTHTHTTHQPVLLRQKASEFLPCPSLPLTTITRFDILAYVPKEPIATHLSDLATNQLEPEGSGKEDKGMALPSSLVPCSL